MNNVASGAFKSSNAVATSSTAFVASSGLYVVGALATYFHPSLKNYNFGGKLDSSLGHVSSLAGVLLLVGVVLVTIATGELAEKVKTGVRVAAFVIAALIILGSVYGITYQLAEATDEGRRFIPQLTGVVYQLPGLIMAIVAMKVAFFSNEQKGAEVEIAEKADYVGANEDKPK